MHSITGKLNKPAKQFQAGESTGFGIRLGEKYKDRQTGQDEWTNYQAAIFAKSPNQIQFYQSVLVEGAIVEISCEKQKISTFDGQNGQVITIEMLNARLGYVHSPQSQAPQQGYQNHPQQDPQRVMHGSTQGQATQQSPNKAAPSNYPQVPHAQQQQPSQAPSMDQFDDQCPF